MPNYTDSPILVTGCARSGTSLTAGILAICGAWIGQTTGPTSHNRRGQFENEYIRDKLTKPFLRSIGADPMGQKPLPDLSEEALRKFGPEWRLKVISAIQHQGYVGSCPWMYKGAKACLVWPKWAEAFPAANWVIVRRADERIIDSCLHTGFMRKYRTREGWQEWIDHHKRQWDAMHKTKLNITEVWPDELVRAMHWDEYRIVRWLVESFGLKWREREVKDFVDPKLWNG